MFSGTHTPKEVAVQNLRRLFVMRNFMVAGQALVVGAALLWLKLDLPLIAIGSVTGFLILLNIATWLRLRRPAGVGDYELLLQLLLDMTALTLLFYYTGGYSNPFVWMYLLPLTIAAVALPWAYTWLVAILSIICYTGLMFYYNPLALQHVHHHGNTEFGTHLLGMWLGFVMSAGIIAYFVVRIQRNLLEYDHMLADAREKVLESERMLALGTLATAAAHELGTPLATMAVLAGEMAPDCAQQPQLAEPLALLRLQIKRCKEILTSITATAGQQRAEDGYAQALDAFLQQTIDRWQDSHPATRLGNLLRSNTSAPVVLVDRTLRQALVNLLDNAADASPSHVEISGEWNDRELRLAIRDFGLGITPDIAKNIGTPFVTSKQESGLGLGLYLARLIFERFGGTVSLANHPEGGAEAVINLPLKTLLVKEG